MDGWLGFILAGVALTGSPGPNTLSLAAAGAAFGSRRSIAYMFGLNVGMLVVMAVTATGVAGLLMTLPGSTPIVTGLAAVYFAYLAYRIATAPPLAEDAGGGRHPSFLAGVLLSLVNPKAYAAMAALFSGFVLVSDAVATDATVKVVALAAIIAAVNLVWLNAGAALTRRFRDPATNRVINVTFAVLLVASVAAALLL